MEIVFKFPIRIYIEDTDAGGIVYHANHIKFMERARTEWLRSMGLAHYWVQDDFNLVVYKLDIAYHKPIVMNDLIEVSAYVTAIKAASFEVIQQILRDGQVIASGKVTIACVTKDLRARALPVTLKIALQQDLAKAEK